MLLIIKPALLSMLQPHVRLKATMLYTCALMSSSRSIRHVTCHVTAMSHAFHHPKENQYKIRKIKEKLLVFKHPITIDLGQYMH